MRKWPVGLVLLVCPCMLAVVYGPFFVAEKILHPNLYNPWVKLGWMVAIEAWMFLLCLILYKSVKKDEEKFNKENQKYGEKVIAELKRVGATGSVGESMALQDLIRIREDEIDLCCYVSDRLRRERKYSKNPAREYYLACQYYGKAHPKMVEAIGANPTPEQELEWIRENYDPKGRSFYKPYEECVSEEEYGTKVYAPAGIKGWTPTLKEFCVAKARCRLFREGWDPTNWFKGGGGYFPHTFMPAFVKDVRFPAPENIINSLGGMENAQDEGW